VLQRCDTIPADEAMLCCVALLGTDVEKELSSHFQSIDPQSPLPVIKFNSQTLKDAPFLPILPNVSGQSTSANRGFDVSSALTIATSIITEGFCPTSAPIILAYFKENVSDKKAQQLAQCKSKKAYVKIASTTGVVCAQGQHRYVANSKPCEYSQLHDCFFCFRFCIESSPTRMSSTTFSA